MNKELILSFSLKINYIFLFSPVALNRVWCGDMIFIRLQDKWYYLALVVDLYARQIVGSSLSLTADFDLCPK